MLMPVAKIRALPMTGYVLIVEIQVRGAAGTSLADQEFVELYNTTDQPINLSTWKLQYKSATGASWTDKAALHGSLAAGSRYLLVSDKYPDPPVSPDVNQELALDIFNAGLSDSGGHIRIVDLVVPRRAGYS